MYNNRHQLGVLKFTFAYESFRIRYVMVIVPSYNIRIKIFFLTRILYFVYSVMYLLTLFLNSNQHFFIKNKQTGNTLTTAHIFSVAI